MMAAVGGTRPCFITALESPEREWPEEQRKNVAFEIEIWRTVFRRGYKFKKYGRHLPLSVVAVVRHHNRIDPVIVADPHGR